MSRLPHSRAPPITPRQRYHRPSGTPEAAPDTEAAPRFRRTHVADDEHCAHNPATEADESRPEGTDDCGTGAGQDRLDRTVGPNRIAVTAGPLT